MMTTEGLRPAVLVHLKVDYFKAFGIWTYRHYIIDAGTTKPRRCDNCWQL